MSIEHVANIIDKNIDGQAIPINYNQSTCRFEPESKFNWTDISHQISVPLSVILQITRRCNLSCIFCSEIDKMPDATLCNLSIMKKHLKGVKRIYLSGGEPFLRNDLDKIISIFKDDFVIGLPTNATLTSKISPAMVNGVDFVVIGMDGPRKITSSLRGNYDDILKGTYTFIKLGVPISICSVILSSTIDSLPFTAQLADALSARKLKLVTPIPKGNALNIPENEYIDEKRALEIISYLSDLKNKFDWRMKISLTMWNSHVEGYSLLVHPNGDTFAWPVYDNDDKLLFLGNLISEDISILWERYPFKINHLKKYLGESILLA